MTEPEPPYAFVGRSDELGALDSCVRAASAGRSSVAWIEGEAGSGKTALVRRALRGLPAEFRLIRAQGDELGVDAPFGVATQLGLVTASQPFAAGMELVEAWASLQDRGPVAVVVEDFHWVDEASRLAILAAVQRIDEDSIVVLITSRPVTDERWNRSGLTRSWLWSWLRDTRCPDGKPTDCTTTRAAIPSMYAPCWLS